MSFMKKLSLCFSAVILLTAFFCGCSSNDADQTDKDPSKFENMPKRQVKKTLQKIPTGDCELKIPYDITVTAGTSQELNIQLAYYGRKTLEVKEWYMFDRYNFEIRYRRLETNKLNNKKIPFKVFRLKPPKGANRSGLILNRGNRAVLSMNLPFVGELNPGEKALFEVYVSTTLKTFKLRSNRMLVRAQ